MDIRQLLRFCVRRLLTERSVAALVIVSMVLVVTNPLQWDSYNRGENYHRNQLSRTIVSHTKSDKLVDSSLNGNKFNILSRFGGNVFQWRGTVRRFALFERQMNITKEEPEASGDVFIPEDTTSNLPSRNDLVVKDRGMLLPHGDDPGCYFVERLERWGLPLVHSIFADQVDRKVIITGVRRPTKDYSWHLEKFRCEFYPPGMVPQDATELTGNFSRLITVPTDPMIKDEQKIGVQPQGVFIITCRLPRQLYDVDVFKFNLRRLTDDQPDQPDQPDDQPDQSELAHTNITVCRSLPKKYSTHFLSICTMLKHMDKYVSHWLEYHRLLGVERAYIYDNAQYSTLVTAPGIQQHLHSGFLTIIPWSHSYSEDKTYLETQIASENDCLWRHRHDAKWMIKTDVDEFIQPMNPDMPDSLVDYLKQPFLEGLAGVRLQNWFFCQFDKKMSKKARRRDGGNGMTVFHRNLYSARGPTPINKGRDKSIVRPDRVHYFKIHAIKWGGDVLSFDPQTELRMVHYRGDNPRHPSFCPKIVHEDTSMLELWQKLTNTSNIQ